VFDTILYIDVLEHIERDAEELQGAADRLAVNGHLIVLSPAHQWLFAPFDAAIGHYRRYTRASLRNLTPQGLDLRRLRYLDCVGLLASSGNRFVLRSAMPTPSQIALWDKLMVPMSSVLDRLAGYRLGKTVYAIWQRPSAGKCGAPGHDIDIGIRQTRRRLCSIAGGALDRSR
jgi:hypothetical protein